MRKRESVVIIFVAMETRRDRAAEINLGKYQSGIVTVDGNSIVINNLGTLHVVIVGSRARKISRSVVQYKSKTHKMCMVYNNAILRINTPFSQEAVGCSCPDFLFRSLPFKKGEIRGKVYIGKESGEAIQGCKHMLYVNEYYLAVV